MTIIIGAQTMDVQTQAEKILHTWALNFHKFDEYPDGISIVPDGFAMDDDDNEDPQQPCYAIFVHRDSLSGQFPEHDTYGGIVVHRPIEEVCFYVWLDLATNQEQEINTPDTELDLDEFYRMIIEIQRSYRDQ
jgi:hypothetical protein